MPVPNKEPLTSDITGKLVVLGCGTSLGVPALGCSCPVCRSNHPRNQRTRCSVILGLPEGNLLIDTTPDMRTQLLRESIGIVHAVAWTHEHSDHVVGFDDLRLMQFYLGTPVPGYCNLATARRLVALYRENQAGADALLREAVARCWVEAEAYTLETYRTVSRLLAGGKIGAEASLNKIFWSELDLRMHETALRILGARAELLPEAPAARGVGDWLDGYLFSLSGPIYAGTNEIQRNVIAERILGLPRE